MIFDSLKNSGLYCSLHPRLARAFELIGSTDWTAVEPGIHELDGRDIYVNVMDVDLKRKPDAKLEVHNEYIDIQVLISGREESFGWSERRNLRRPLAEFDAGNDIQLFDDEPQTYYTVRPGQFTMLLPEDGHAPWWARATSARSSSRCAADPGLRKVSESRENPGFFRFLQDNNSASPAFRFQPKSQIDETILHPLFCLGEPRPAALCTAA